MNLLVALSRDDVATYVDALFTVYFILIIIRIVLSWIQQFRPIPYNVPLRPVLTPNGTASSVMTSVTNGNASLRCSSTAQGTAFNPLEERSPMNSRSWVTVIISASGCSVAK